MYPQAQFKLTIRYDSFLWTKLIAVQTLFCATEQKYKMTNSVKEEMA